MAKKKKRIEKVDTAGYLKFFEDRLRDIKETIGQNYTKSDYRETIKTMIKVSMKKRSDKGDYGIKSDCDMIDFFKSDPIFLKRRMDALMEYMPILSEKFKISYPDISLERIVLDMHKCPTNTLPDSMFINDGEFSSRCLTLTIAIYILDELYRNNTIWEAMLFLPNNKENIDSITLPDEHFIDAVFPNEIIKSMIYLIENRDNEKSVFINPTTATRTTKSTPTIEHTLSQITCEQYQSGDNETINAIREQAATMSNREKMDKILSLMSPEIIKRATTRFENKLYDLFDITFSICQKPMLEITDMLNDIITSLKNLLKMEKRMDNIGKHISDTISSHMIKPNCLMLQKQTDIPNNILSDLTEIRSRNAIEGDTAWELGKAWSKQYDTLIDQQNHADEVTKQYYRDIYLIENGHCHNFRYENNENVAEHMSKLTIENPYELLFAYFYLLDRGSNIVWLIEPAAALIDLAVSRLPWAGVRNEKLSKCIQKMVDDEFEISNKSDKDYSEQESKLYQMNFTDFIDWHICGINPETPNDLQNVNFVQLIYQLSNMNLPRNMNVFDDNMYRGFARTGISKKNIPLTRLFIETNNFVSKHDQFKLPQTAPSVDSENDQSDNSELRKTIAEKTDQITQLKTALYNAERKAKEEQEKATKIAENSALEHDELIELRELIYKIQNDTDSCNITDDENTITLPYTPKRNIVIFGGHATWLKAIRPLLPKVRFIEPQMNPDINMIQNADIVWMQSNAMPHCYYNKIMDITRQKKIPVKYFAYASAEKCAKQLAEDDMTK